jgi:hypothetical protein
MGSMFSPDVVHVLNFYFAAGIFQSASRGGGFNLLEEDAHLSWQQ